MVSDKDFPLLLDVEEQRRREDEVSCATRLCKRILKAYPRAFDVVITDGLYLEAPFFNLFLEHGKHIIAVLKDERRDLMEVASMFLPESGSLHRMKNNNVRYQNQRDSVLSC